MSRQNKIIIGAVVGFILVIVVAFCATLSKTQHLRLYNIDQVESGLSSQRINELEEFVWQGLRNAKLFGGETNEVIALIRPASFTLAEKDKMRSYSFLIDLDDYKATYLVSFTLMKGQGFYETPNVNCPARNLMKYPETECRSEKTSTVMVTIGRHLPYEFTLSTGQPVRVSSGMSEDGKEVVNVKVSSCGNESISDAARLGVEAWIRTLGFEAENYKILIPEYCDGEF